MSAGSLSHRLPLLSPLACLILACLFLLGCPGPPQAPIAHKTQSDALFGYYADLATGRFAVLADFEDQAHMELFQLHAHGNGPGRPTLRESGGVSATGGGCLELTLGDRRDQLVASNAAARTWVLKRHWRSYSLLIMSVHCPLPALTLDVTLVSGTGRLASETRSTIHLEKGWNLVRIDLGRAGDYVALDDVREIRWAIPDLQEPVLLKLDDVLLADNRSELFGTADQNEGMLYVVRDGRSLIVGAAKRFELVFADGQIVRWFALGDDPTRLHNLIDIGSVLGPVPIVVPETEGSGVAQAVADPIGGFLALGGVIETKQRVVEANRVRVVVECERVFGDESPALSSSATSQRWIYAIYPSGWVLVDVQCPSQAEGFFPRSLGLAVSRSAGPGTPVTIHTPGDPSDPTTTRDLVFASIGDDQEPGMLWVLKDPEVSPLIRPVRDLVRRRVSLVACGGPVDRPIHRWACLLTVWPSGNCGSPAREQTAAAYCTMPSTEFLVGGLAVDTAGDHDRDGFNERYGALMLQPEFNRVQVRLGASGYCLGNPVFCVVDSADREAWVYADYVIHEETARDADGNLIFALPPVVDREVTVEVYLRRSSRVQSVDMPAAPD